MRPSTAMNVANEFSVFSALGEFLEATSRVRIADHLNGRAGPRGYASEHSCAVPFAHTVCSSAAGHDLGAGGGYANRSLGGMGHAFIA